jgi:Fe-S-cluster-containing dehydrogenase component
MVKYGLVIEAKKCIGCDICVQASKDEYIGNDYLPYSKAQPEPIYKYYKEMPPDAQAGVEDFTYIPGQNWTNVVEAVRGNAPYMDGVFLPMPCMMCENAPCIDAFPDQIYMRPDGIVIIDPEEPAPPEIVDSCPYGHIYYNEALGIGQKDTWDVHLIEQGKTPKFVEACPFHVYHFGDLDDPTSEVSQLVSSGEAKPLHPEFGTQPKVFYVGQPLPTVAGYLMDSTTKLDIEGATVVLVNLFTGETVLTESDLAGNFRAEDLQMGGLYMVRVAAPGYYPRARIAYLKGDGYAHLGKMKLFPK